MITQITLEFVPESNQYWGRRFNVACPRK